jgi:hypothetical protein
MVSLIGKVLQQLCPEPENIRQAAYFLLAGDSLGEV